MKKRRGRKGIFFLFVLIGVTLVAFFSLRQNVKPVIFTYCDALIASLGMECINSSTADVVALYEYSDFADLERGEDGRILYLGTNAALANGFVRSLALRCENALNALGRQEISVPIGAFTGSALLSDRGPEVAVGVTFFSSVHCDFISTFESAGINQTRHALYAKVDVLFNTVLPIAEHEIALTNTLLIAESVIVGEIPNVYVAGEDGVNYLDLIP